MLSLPVRLPQNETPVYRLAIKTQDHSSTTIYLSTKKGVCKHTHASAHTPRLAGLHCTTSCALPASKASKS